MGVVYGLNKASKKGGHPGLINGLRFPLGCYSQMTEPFVFSRLRIRLCRPSNPDAPLPSAVGRARRRHRRHR